MSWNEVNGFQWNSCNMKQIHYLFQNFCKILREIWEDNQIIDMRSEVKSTFWSKLFVQSGAIFEATFLKIETCVSFEIWKIGIGHISPLDAPGLDVYSPIFKIIMVSVIIAFNKKVTSKIHLNYF